MNTETNATIDDLAHEAWAAAQMAPGDGIEDAVRRIAVLIAAALDSLDDKQIEVLTSELRRRLDAKSPPASEWMQWTGKTLPCSMPGKRMQWMETPDGDIVAYCVAA
jgi:hypothetical protein